MLVPQSEKSEAIETFLWFDDQGKLQFSEARISDHDLPDKALVSSFIEAHLTNTTSPAFLFDQTFEDVWRLVGDGEDVDQSVFAKAFTRYLVRPDFRCVRPMIYRYFEQRYQMGRTSACDEPIGFRVLSSLKGMELMWVDPKRVKAIHVLFAGNADGLISRFGHVALRLVVCPENSQLSADCDANLYEHIALGYRAHVNEFMIDSIKGLKGDYRAYLFANPFMETYQEYAITEFRDLYSLPLNLNKEERLQFLRTLAEVHWSFTGDYRFLDENCATWLQDLMREGLSGYSMKMPLQTRYWRPDYFFSALKETDYLNAKLLNDLDQAEQNGHFFPNTEPVYEQAFHLVTAALKSSPYDSLTRYLSADPRRRYITLREDQAYWDMLTRNARLLDAQLLLEELALVRIEQRLMAAFSSFFERNKPSELAIALRAKLSPVEYETIERCMLKPFREFQAPIRQSEGIPNQASELAETSLAPINALSCHLIGENTAMPNALKILASHDESAWLNIEASAHYRNATINNISDLNRLKTK